MEQTVIIKKPNKYTTKEELEKVSKEDLILKIQSLEAHNLQLQNIISKSSKFPASNVRINNFDFSKCRFRHILLHLFYLGWDCQGFAVQEDTTNTIEFNLFQALTKTCLIKERSTSNYNRCGRTDKGVSSFGQVISIDVRSKLDTENEYELDKEIDYCKILNKVLPPYIQCVAWAPVESSFSARFDCLSRTYKYYFPKGQLNIDKMKEAATHLIGTHDFRNFAKMDVGNGVVQFIRNMSDVRIEPLEPNNSEIDAYSIYVAIIQANAFLWHQIRYIMGILFLIGANKEDPSIISELLDVNKNPRKPEYNMANEVPLNLFYCEYGDVNWQLNSESLKCVIEKLQEIWTLTTIKSVMIKDMISNLFGKLNESEKTKCFSEHLIGGAKRKSYIPVMKRQKCGNVAYFFYKNVTCISAEFLLSLLESLENKIEHYSKRKRIEIVSNDEALNK